MSSIKQIRINEFELISIMPLLNVHNIPEQQSPILHNMKCPYT